MTARNRRRIAQTVARLAARSDLRETPDRLASHLVAAHALLAEPAHIGHRSEVLVLNREANTLCSKSASVALTATDRCPKALIQPREQMPDFK